MRPLRIVLENFGSFQGDHDIDLSGVNLAVLSGPNGAGKSTLSVDSIRFALFGTTRGPLDSIITRGQDRCRVEFTFALGDETYLVSRQRSRKGSGSTLLSFQTNTGDGWRILDGKSAVETQARIENLLRMGDDLFVMTACANQGNAAAFSQAKPAQRKQVLAEILNLEAWEKRAQIARQMQSDLAGKTENDRARLVEYEQQAAQAEAIADEMTRLEAQQQTHQSSVAAKETELAEGQSARENIVRDEAADRARRSQLADIRKQLATAEQAIAEGKGRIAALQQKAGEVEEVKAAIAEVEEAQTQAEAMEGTRQEDDRLKHEADLTQQKYEAAFREHRGEVETLTRRIADAQRNHGREVADCESAIQGLRKQSEVLDQVPCANPVDEATRPSFFAIRDKCPLIAQAREAAAALPALEEKLKGLLAQQPWAEDETRLEELHGQEPGAEHMGAVNGVKAKRMALGYDAQAHQELKAAAARMNGLQQRLTESERAGAQTAEIQAAVETRSAERENLGKQCEELAASLGPEKNWRGLLDCIDRQISSVRSAIGDLQKMIQGCGRERGATQARLEAAKQAGEQAQKLAVEINAAGRRITALKILAQACSKAGVPALLIERAVPDLEAAANEVLTVLTDGRMSLRLQSQRETKAGTLQETLDVLIADENAERAYETFSGGESMRVDLALRVGLSTLLAHRAGARCEMLCLDEVAAPLDMEGRTLFVDCLSRIADRFATVLCITHTEDLKDAFPCLIQVTKDANGSHAEVIAA